MKSILRLLPLSVCFVLSSAMPATWYVDDSVGSSGDGKSWATAFQKIQEGIDAASSGDTLIVARGFYFENIHFDGKNIILTSTDPLDPVVVAKTIIAGNASGSVVTFSGTETQSCMLSGFTITVGKADFGGGIYGGTDPDYSHATIQNNTITHNSAEYGGGLSGCDGTIQNNTITSNSAGEYGGGLAYCNGTIQNNTIAGNSAIVHAGGLARCDGTVQNNTITDNSAEAGGGGLYACGGTIQNNTITDNSARYGGGLVRCDGTIQNNTISGNSATLYGGGLYQCYGTVQNSTITDNSAGHYGGGLHWCEGTVQNNTITSNSAGEYGGGLYEFVGTIRNCIVWANTAPTGPQLHESSIPTYSCILGWTGDYKKRNISGDPCFAGADTGDFRLLPSSPCIHVGYNDPALPPTDIAGMHRIMFGRKSLTVDMGAWEYYINTLSPELGGNAILTWSSLSGKTYPVLTSSDMLTWQTAAETVPSLGNTTTTWADTAAPFLSPPIRIRYYRTVEK